jgi:hypothetical protein
MSTRVIATVRLNATCHRELCEQLGLSVDPVGELSRLNSIIGSGQLSLPDLQQMISTPSASVALCTLAPAEFSRVRAHTEGGSRSALETTAADLQAELAETLAVATIAVMTSTRDITANTFAESGRELGYAVTTQQAETATFVELRRGQGVVSVAVHNGGKVEFDHCGLTDTCAERQFELERAAERRGVFVTQRPEPRDHLPDQRWS